MLSLPVSEKADPAADAICYEHRVLWGNTTRAADAERSKPKIALFAAVAVRVLVGRGT